jgi:rubrerythrin
MIILSEIDNMEDKMNLIEEAIALEISTEQFYRNLIENCAYNPEIKKILVMLAEDTIQHIEQLRKTNKEMKPGDRDSDFFLKAKEIFHSLQQKKDFSVCSLDQIPVYEHALENLKKTISLYEDMISQPLEDREKEILTIIFNEKRKHVYLLDNIVELLLHPAQWVENGEFNHFEEF